MQTEMVQTGGSFDVTLQGRGTAGYEWQFEINHKDILQITRKGQNLTGSRNVLPGSSVDEIFTVTGLKKGVATIHFILVRTWEDSAIAPIEEKRIKVEVG
jgi:predicted secreted protein